jgi:hypothetical protein
VQEMVLLESVVAVSRCTEFSIVATWRRCVGGAAAAVDAAACGAAAVGYAAMQ